MKAILIGVFLGFIPLVYGQDTIKNFIGLQFGGQALVGLTYDRLLVKRNNFKLNGSLGIVLNEYADDQDPLDRPIYGMNLGLIALYDLKYVFAEVGMFSSPYFYKSNTFINYYSWLGLRVNSRAKPGAFISIGWTPSLYFSKTPPEKYNDVRIAIKLGVNF